MKTSGTDLLLNHYLDWQKSEGRVKTLKDFAAFCGINESYLNLVMNRKRPFTQKMALRLAHVLRDPQFYDVVELPRPDPDLEIVSSNWEFIPPDRRKAIREEAERFKAGHENKTVLERRTSDSTV